MRRCASAQLPISALAMPCSFVVACMLLPHASMCRLMLGKDVPLLSDKVKDSICAWVLVVRVSNKMTHALLQKAQKDCSFLDATFII